MRQLEEMSVAIQSHKEQRVQVRNGMRMVLEDRLQKTNRNNTNKFLFDTLNYIHSEYRNGFTVNVLMNGSYTIDTIVYTSTPNNGGSLIYIRDNDTLLFVIYRHYLTKQLSLHVNEVALLPVEEQEFHARMEALVEESKMINP